MRVIKVYGKLLASYATYMDGMVVLPILWLVASPLRLVVSPLQATGVSLAALNYTKSRYNDNIKHRFVNSHLCSNKIEIIYKKVPDMILDFI